MIYKYIFRMKYLDMKMEQKITLRRTYTEKTIACRYMNVCTLCSFPGQHQSTPAHQGVR